MAEIEPYAADRPRRPYLVLARVGDKTLHDTWLDADSGGRTWDLQLNSYAEDRTKAADRDLPTVFDYGTKWDSIARHLRAHPELLDQYPYIMLPDDDLLMSSTGIDRLFELAVENDLTMAAPVMTLDSYMSHALALQAPGFQLRYCTFLESMACCIKSEYLRALLPMFEDHFTGWGTDLVWALLMDDPAYRAAIVDEVPMVHTRPLYSGPIYSTFVEGKIDPEAEVEKMISGVENHPRKMRVYGGKLTGGRPVGAFGAQLRNGLGLLWVAPRAKKHWVSARMGLVLILRAFTDSRYRPEQLRPLPGSELAGWGLGAVPADQPVAG